MKISETMFKVDTSSFLFPVELIDWLHLGSKSKFRKQELYYMALLEC